MLPKKIKQFGNKVMLVTGASSFSESENGKKILKALKHDFELEIVKVHGEPSADLIDDVCKTFKNRTFDVIVSVGGGSAIDTGKAISAMLPVEGSIRLYLEGNPSGIPHPGLKIPFIAAPTTAGTGSEMTKNAVISQVGENGFKRSIRHDNFYPEVAIVDPELTLNCPANVTAASGLDAFTQLLEAYTSTQASTFSDLLAIEGLKHIERSLVKAYKNGNYLEARTDMAYAAMLSGIVLANAGLGAVHGFASSVGALFNIPHGIVCGTLIAATNRLNIEKLSNSNSSSSFYLRKYVEVGKMFCNENGKSDDYYLEEFLNLLEKLLSDLQIPKLSNYGVSSSYIDKIVVNTSIKNNPVKLDKDDLATILKARL
jgi:alcohol dehydrogenase class IV